MTQPQPIRVLFVCAGNTCRSPMAEAVFQHLVDQAGLSAHFKIDSAGTQARPGEATHPETRRVLAERGIVYEGQARLFTRADFEAFDHILAMDRDNLSALQTMRPAASAQPQVRLLLDFAPEAGTDEVPDPLGTDRYEAVYDLIRAGVEGLLEYLRKEGGL